MPLERRRRHIRKLKKYKPTEFMAKNSYYDKDAVYFAAIAPLARTFSPTVTAF